jgi:hypothetical protein
MKSLGERLNSVLGALLLEAQVTAVDYSRDRISQGSGGHGAHGDPSKPPTGTSRPLVTQWAERFERMIERAEIDAGLRPAEEAVPRSDKRTELRRKMAEYEGYLASDVAFFERVSESLVRSVRKDMGRDMVEGHRLERRERPLTAPARHSLQLLQDAVGGEL